MSEQLNQSMEQQAIESALGLVLLQAKYKVADAESKIALQRLINVVNSPSSYEDPSAEIDKRFQAYESAQRKVITFAQIDHALRAAAEPPVKETPTQK